MGKYRSYAQKLDTLVRERFSDYEKAAAAYEEARKAKFATPMKTGWGVTPEYQLKAKKAEINFMEAEAEYKKAKEVYGDTLKEAEAIRAELLEEMSTDGAVNPANLDRNVVDILNAGICSDDEIIEMYNAANVTTKRLIAKHADDRIKMLMSEDNGGESPELFKNRNARQKLQMVTEDSKRFLDPERSDTIQYFDTAMGALKRTLDNPAMIPFWGQLTESVLEEV